MNAISPVQRTTPVANRRSSHAVLLRKTQRTTPLRQTCSCCYKAIEQNTEYQRAVYKIVPTNGVFTFHFHLDCTVPEKYEVLP